MQWPALLRPLSPIVNEMPSLVLDRYNSCQTVAFCGALPQIQRAWATVDNSLFLWRHDRWQDVPIEYSGEDQAIVALGIAKPRPGVFVEAIQYVLVVCTATQILLLGVCCSSGPSGKGGPYEEITLQPLPLYSVSSDNVPMVSVASSSNGRIFMGGSDGNLYELHYSEGTRFRQKKCTKVCHTGGLRTLLPAFVPAFLFGPPAALIDLTVDDHRGILYARTATSALQVFDVGARCQGSKAHKVAECTDFLAEAARCNGGREVFGRGSGDKRGASVVYMAAIPPSDSSRLHLLTLTADGRRVYWSVAAAARSASSETPRPDRLRPEIARQAMPSSSVGRASAALLGIAGTAAGATTRSTSGPRGLEVVAAHYSNGCLLIAEGSSSSSSTSAGGTAARQSSTRLFLLSRDLTIPPVGTATGTHISVSGLRENISELELPLPGEACAIVPLATTLGTPSSSSTICIRSDATSINIAPAPRFVIVTTAGVLEVEKRRPVDVLSHLLEEKNAAKLELFFKSYGAPEAAAMCVLLASSMVHTTSSGAAAGARGALEDVQLVGETEVREVVGPDATMYGQEQHHHQQQQDTGGYGGFDMGTAVPVAEPEWSGAHKGIALYSTRILTTVWDELIASQKGGALFQCTLSSEVLGQLEVQLRSLDVFLSGYLTRRKATIGATSRRQYVTTTPAAQSSLAASWDHQHHLQTTIPPAKRQRLEDASRQELAKGEAIQALVARTAQASFLLRVLTEHNLGRLAARAEDVHRNALRVLRFRDWAASEEGEALAAALVSVLVAEHLHATGGVAEDLAAALTAGCPAFFREEDKTFYQATGLLQRAEAASTVVDREGLTREAVNLMSKAPLAVDLGQVVPQLAYLRALSAVVDLTLRKASALDPGNVAGTITSEGGEVAAAQARRYDGCYQHVVAVLRILLSGAPSASGPLEAFEKSVSAEGDRNAQKQFLLKKIASTEDPLFHEAMYATLMEMKDVEDLLQMGTQYLEPYLIKAGGLESAAAAGDAHHKPPKVGPLTPIQVAHADALARLYIARCEYAAAARVYEVLAERAAAPGESDVSLADRLACLQKAVLQARSCGVGSLLDRLESKARVVALQRRLVEALQDKLAILETLGLETEVERESLKDTISDLLCMPKELAELYNDVAVPQRLWRLCLEAMDISSYGDAAYVAQLWDLHLREICHNAGTTSSGAGVEACCREVESLGESFYPNESSFPVSHVLARLEAVAAGLWPDDSMIPAEDHSRTVRAMLGACKNSYEAVVRAYEGLLSMAPKEGSGVSELLHVSKFRLYLLQSALVALKAACDTLSERSWNGGGAGGGYRGSRREAASLGGVCDAFIAEARTLGADDLTSDFETLKSAGISPFLGYNSTYL